MAKKKAGDPKVPATAPPKVRHARVELPPEIYEQLEKAADELLLPITAWLRIAVIEKLKRDKMKNGGKAE